MGKDQKIHHFNRLILKPYILFLFLSGLIIGFNIGFFIASVAIIAPLLVLLLYVSPTIKRGKSAIITMVAALLIGFALGVPKTKARDDYGVYQGIVIETRGNYFLFESGFHRYYVYEKDSVREEGDILSIKGRASPLSFTTYEGYFDFGSYLNTKGVDSQLKTDNVTVIFERPIRFAAKEKAFLDRFEDPLTKGLISSVLFGNKDYTNEAISLASSMNALNFFSVSGILFGALLKFLDWLFGLGFKEKKTKTIVLVLATFLLPFGIRKVGFWRVFLGRIISYFCLMKDAKLHPISKTSIVGILLFVINPYNALSSGYLIGFGISFFMTLTSSYRTTYQRKDKKAADFLFLMVFLMPLFIKGNEFHILSPLYSFIIIPLIYPFAALGLMSFISMPFVTVLNAYSEFILGFLSFVKTFDYSVTVGLFNEYTMFGYYYGMSLFFFHYDRGLTNVSFNLATVGLLALLINVCPIFNYLSNEVSFLNVGQGDSIFIRNKDKTILIDVGGNTNFDLAQEVTIPFLKSQRITHLDYVIITHYDSDHSGALDSLMNNYSVKHLIDSHNSFPLTVGDITIESLNEGKTNQDDNENSLVLKMDFMGKKWLFMGDAPEKIEREIIKKDPELDCDILKVGHHGSDTSTCVEFLETVTPEEAIISVGRNNRYGHPSDKIQLRLDRYGAKVRRTDLEGTITYRKYFSSL